MAELWHIQLFGGLQARQGSRALPYQESCKPGMLLALLALGLRSREALAEALWPEDQDGDRLLHTGVKLERLRQTLYTLRKQMGDGAGEVLCADHARIWLNPRAVRIDVVEFSQALEAAACAAGPLDRAGHLLRCGELFSAGALLPDCEGNEPALRRAQMEEAYLGAVSQLGDALAEAGDRAEADLRTRAIACARRALEIDPAWDETHCALMRLYLASGQPHKAERQYYQFERALLREKAGTPSEAARDLLRRARAGMSRPFLPVPVRESGTPSSPRPSPAPVNGPSSPSKTPVRLPGFAAGVLAAGAVLWALWMSAPGK